MRLPDEFLRYHERLLGREYDSFISHIQMHYNRWSLRVNTLKCEMSFVKKALKEHRIEYAGMQWCDDCLWVGEGGLNTMEHQLGFYYIQTPMSMVPPVVLSPADGDRVLDLCAAPGSKTTHLAALMKNRGLLVANEPNFSRIRALVYNLQRCGVRNAIVTKSDGCRYSSLGQEFDRILLDAPCSDVGTVRKNPDALRRWSLERVKRLSSLQKRMIVDAYSMLKPGGSLVYSTCTTSLEENEQVIEHLLLKYDDAHLVRESPPGLEFMAGLTEKARDCIRILPQHNDADSYFIAKVVKDED
ncbi:MAG: RsmB/NOP family class I SAM-dependent RNA methyltransferase [Candidatus Altiarchaeota archaeon]